MVWRTPGGIFVIRAGRGFEVDNAKHSNFTGGRKMKKFFKALALVLALTLVIGTIPAAAADTAIKAVEKKTLYVGGTKGVDNNGKQSTYKAKVTYAKLLGITKKEAKKLKVTAVSSNDEIVKANDKTRRIRAYGIGTVTVTLTADGKTYDVAVTAKKSADEVVFGRDWANVAELDYAVEAELNKEYTVSVPQSKAGVKIDTDERRLVADDDSVIITPVEGKKRLYTVKFTKAGEFTVTGEAFQSEKSYPGATASKSVKVTIAKKDFDATVKGVKLFEVVGSGFTKDTAFTIKKGSAAIDITAKEVSEDGTTAKLSVGNKISDGTYTISDGTNSVDVKAENEKVAKIVVLEDGGEILVGDAGTAAGTTSDRKLIFVHYDVFNQYGESVRKSYSVTWTSSYGGNPFQNNTTDGILTFKGTESIVYGTQVVLTGVYAKDGITVTANMKAGMEQYVDTVDIKGIVKIDDKTTMQSVPANFKANTYAIYFGFKDKNGYAMKYSDDEAQNVTITTSTPLLAEVDAHAVVNKSVVIDGVEYAYVFIKPGYNAKDGGVADLLFISSKTGGKTPYELQITKAQVLKSFTIMDYGDVIANDDWRVKLNYEALDQEGKPITDFETLVGEVNLTGDNLYLEETNDRKAELVYYPSGISATENVDVPVLLMATVIKTGESSSIMPSVKETRKAAAVKGFNVDTPYVVEGGTLKVSVLEAWYENKDSVDAGVRNVQLKFYDQYEGTLNSMKGNGYKLKVEYDNTKFAAVDSNGNPLTATTNGSTSSCIWTPGTATDFDMYFKVLVDAGVAKTEESALTMTILKSDGTVVAGSEKKVIVGVADISQVRDFALTTKTNTPASRKTNEDGATFYVSGTLTNGKKVAVPFMYADIKELGKKINNTYINGTASASALSSNFTDIYGTDFFTFSFANDAGGALTAGLNDFTDLSGKLANGQYAKKFIDVTFSANIYGLTASGSSLIIDTEKKIGAASCVIPVSDQTRKLVSINHSGWNNHLTNVSWIAGYGDPITAYIKPYSGVISTAELKEVFSWGNGSAAQGGDFSGSDQYGASIGVTGGTIEISKYVEAETGLYTDNINGSSVVISGSGTGTVTITNAEVGDTFVATYTAKDANGNYASKSITFTVSRDDVAKISPSNNKPAWY
jgi:hypothetical protein